MGREFEKIGTEKLTPKASCIIVCDPKEAALFVEKLLNKQNAQNEPVMILVVDGKEVKPQSNFARAIEKYGYAGRKDRFSLGHRKYLADKAVNAGLYVAILEKSIIESDKWAIVRGTTHDTSWEEKNIQRTKGYPDTETDKIIGAGLALSYPRKAAEQLGLSGVTLIILNYDKIEHPSFGPKYNGGMVGSFMLSDKIINTLLFRDKKIERFNR